VGKKKGILATPYN